MRLVFLGSGAFGIPTLRALAEQGHDIVAVVSQPDRPAGRGGKCRATPIRETAEHLGLPILTPEKPNTPEFAEVFRRLEPELAVVVAYGHLIKKPLLDIPRHGFVNLHASLLPAYRGAAPVPWAILKGETTSGATVFRLDERFDTGAIIAQAELPIVDDDTSASYLEKLAPIGGDLMAQTVADIQAGRVRPQIQDNALASLAPKMKKDDGIIDWTRQFAEIERLVRAFQPWPLAHTRLASAKGDIKINILAMEPVETANSHATAGAILAADPKTGLVIMAGDRPARIVRLQPEGKRPMADNEFLRGTKIQL